jgi:hypothetical protein
MRVRMDYLVVPSRLSDRRLSCKAIRWRGIRRESDYGQPWTSPKRVLAQLALRRLPAESRSELLLHLQACLGWWQKLQAERHYIETIHAVRSAWPTS